MCINKSSMGWERIDFIFTPLNIIYNHHYHRDEWPTAVIQCLCKCVPFRVMRQVVTMIFWRLTEASSHRCNTSIYVHTLYPCLGIRNFFFQIEFEYMPMVDECCIVYHILLLPTPTRNSYFAVFVTLLFASYRLYYPRE
jgi:hypothetical protein